MRTDVTDLSLTDLMAQAGVLSQQGQVPVAIALYRAWLAVRVADPLRYVALFNLGVLHGSLQQPQEAEPLYREALRLQPTLLQARLNLGHALENQGKLDDAVAQWQQVLDELAAVPQPDVALQLHALNNLARALESAKRYDEAEAYMARSLQVEPDQSAVLQHYVHIRQKQCKWPVYQPIGDVTINRQLLSTSALAMLAAYDDPALQLLAARQFVHEKTQAPVPRKPRRVRQAGERIRIGYLSGDLCMHAVGLLTVELFELHDRSRFEVFGFCWSNDDGSPLRERLIKAFDHHVRIGHLSDEQAAQVIEACGIDILVDLQGLTSGARPNILMQRPAGAVQISYLGLPGTSALPTVDYIVADDFVFPPELEPFMTEKPLRLPRCYQVSDRQRDVGPPLTRAACGLPDDRFVFAAFNNNYKITPEVFATWMRILTQVPDSVLWLMADNRWSEQNLRDQAKVQGIDPARLIFAGRAFPAEYMARLALPDLFLDTLPYNAGTTANDILWMGTPILTCSGKTYISRMCGSLLTAVGLPDLITFSLAEYECKAVQLGRNPKRIASHKRYLDEHRRDSELFDMPQLVRDLETALTHSTHSVITSMSAMS
ncbi:tetratricopeptide repeat protein [Malikia spinosa]|nr:tetratricopeptide repeat protein [Malikia spinosa]